MRNLRHVRFGRWSPDRPFAVTSACWDSQEDELVCTLGPTPTDPAIELVRLSGTEPISHRTVVSWDAPSPSPHLPADSIVSIHHLGASSTTCIILDGGDIITVQEAHASEARVEVVGSVDAGIAVAAWSPDEVLTVATKADTLIFMSSSLDPFVEVNMTPDHLEASKHVSVGWGKKETQFQGRGAKALRDPTIPDKVDQGLPSPREQGAATISWRGDGAYVAINSVQRPHRRVVRVYSRQGELDSVSEPVDGLESPLSWRPAGNLIAGIQRLDDRVDVVFFERNGLRHGQFTLATLDDPVVSQSDLGLAWNSDSTVLAVTFQATVQLWIMGNYHWYLKQEIPTDNHLPSLAWHPEKALRLAASTPSSVILAEQIFHTARGTCGPPFDNGAVAVIDGKAVKIIPFRTANVPPPMSLFDIVAEAPVIDVAFGSRNTSLVVLSRKGVGVYEMPMKDGRSAKPRLRAKIPFPAGKSTQEMLPLRICAVASASYRYLAYQGKDRLHYCLDVEAGQISAVEDKRDLVSTTTFEDDICTEGYGQDLLGNLYRLSASSSEPLPIRFPANLPWFEVRKQGAATLAFGLARNGHVYANSRLLAKNCTSFTVTPSHLIFTTSNHFVKYVHLTPDVQDLQVPGDDPERDERCRSIERGSRLVVAMPTNMSIVLQMPRGNVETIFPRAMVVAGIRSLIEDKNYARAFSYCRTQRVDMNILFDHDPAQFLAHAASFLDQLNEVAHIDLFLSSLREDDVTQTMYQDTKRQGPRQNSENKGDGGSAATPTASKVNTVCDDLLKRLQPRKATNLQNIITAHVCKFPPALDDGLALVAELMQEDEKLAERAVEHICFLVDVNRVYENALGLYDLALALLVAQQSQRDPREYLPFIQNLHDLPELRRRFEIDDHLARRSKALAHLQTLEAFDELCDYTTKHDLYQEALRLYRYNAPQLRTLTGLYAVHLESRSAFREAGLAFESLQDYTRATSCYRAAGAACWQECLYAAQQQSPGLSADAMADLATTLADALWEAKDYGAAATIHLDYLSSLDAAVKCLCKGYHFAEAIRIVVQRGRPDLLEAAVDGGLTEALGSTMEFLADCKGQLTAQVPRIVELRQRAVEDPLAFYEGERAGGPDVPDDVSIAASSRLSTSASLFTRYTGKGGSTGTVGTGVSRATSKNRRREEKKRARGRKGTVYEEEYLVNSVRRLVERMGATAAEVERLVFALVRRDMAQRARAAEALMADVLEACERAVSQVFAAAGEDRPRGEGVRRGSEAGDAAAWRPTGGDAVLQDWMEGKSRRLEPPIVAGMSKLALLG